MNQLTDKASAKVAEARKKGEETLHAAKERASKAATDVRAKASDVAATAKARASDAAATAREKSAEAVAATKRGARVAAEKTATGIEQNPLAVLIGGIALGAIAAALLPRTAREDSAVGAVGKKVRATASDAVKAARATGKDQLDALGVNADTARDQFKDIIGKITKAATSAAEAAGESLKKR
jgi:ElaB/YqjD/DUF883 family membrane-anchored ribosome-binding protein